MPRAGSAAVVPQFAPPALPGICIVFVSAGGVKSPLFTDVATIVVHFSRSAGSSLRCGLMSATVKDWRANGSGFVGNGCVGHACSPGTSLSRHRPLLDRPERTPGHAIEHEKKSVLVGHRHGVDRRPPCRTVTSAAGR